MKKIKARLPVADEQIKTRVLLVDDHPTFRQSFLRRVSGETDMMVCGEAKDTHTAIEIVPVAKPDVAVIDIALEGGAGIELLKDFRIRYARLPIVVWSLYDECLYAERALKAGAKGYVLKQEDPTVLFQAIRDVLTGRVHISERVTTKILNRLVGKPSAAASPLERLSDRELQVFDLIGQGYVMKEIGAQLRLSAKTVISHRNNIKRKLKLRTLG